MSRGVFAAVPTPSQLIASNPGTVSPIVGTSGRIGVRAGVVTLSARSRPPRTWGSGDGSESMKNAIWPPERSVSACDAPL